METSSNSSQSELEKWSSKDARTLSLLKGINLSFFLITVLLISILIVLGVHTKENISVVIDDFSIDVSKSKSYPYYFSGIIPYDVVDEFSIDKIKYFELFPNRCVVKAFGVNRKVKLASKEALIKNLGHKLKNSHFRDYRDIMTIRTMEAGLLSARLKRLDIYGNDVTGIFQGLNDQSCSDRPIIEKVRVVFGHTSTLGFWIKKIFNQSDIFKKAGQLIE